MGSESVHAARHQRAAAPQVMQRSQKIPSRGKAALRHVPPPQNFHVTFRLHPSIRIDYGTHPVQSFIVLCPLSQLASPLLAIGYLLSLPPGLVLGRIEKSLQRFHARFSEAAGGRQSQFPG